jgi:hypothetical protein
LFNIGKVLNDPNIIIFATAFSEESLKLPERIDAIEKLYANAKNED